MKKYINIRSLSEAEPPPEMDRKILTVAAFKAAGFRTRRRKIAGTWAAAAAFLLAGAGVLWSHLDSVPSTEASPFRRAELVKMGDFSKMDQENFNLFWESSFQRQAVGELTGKEI